MIVLGVFALIAAVAALQRFQTRIDSAFQVCAIALAGNALFALLHLLSSLESFLLCHCSSLLLPYFCGKSILKMHIIHHALVNDLLAGAACNVNATVLFARHRYALLLQFTQGAACHRRDTADVYLFGFLVPLEGLVVFAGLSTIVCQCVHRSTERSVVSWICFIRRY